MAKIYKLDEIKRGSKGWLVLLLQEILRARGLYKGGLDGQFGPATEEAVRAYQDARTKAGANIGGVDGIVGTKTWGDLLGLARV